jgi:hypothetical protein
MPDRPDSRKRIVQAVFDKKGADVALALGLDLKLKADTVKGWINSWRRANKKKVPEAV